MKSVCRSHARTTNTKTRKREKKKENEDKKHVWQQTASMVCGKTTHQLKILANGIQKKRFSYHFHYDRRKLFRIYINKNN